MLIEKYGRPSDVVEKFDGYSQPIKDNDRMYIVKFDEVKYFSVWRTEKIEIRLSIDHDGFSSCFSKLEYFDRINSEIIKSIAINDL